MPPPTESANARAYRLFRALCARAEQEDVARALQARGIPLLPLLQRHLTEALLVAEGAPEGALPTLRHAARGLLAHMLLLPRFRTRPGLAQRLDSAPQRRALFVAYYPNHLPSFLPLLSALQAEGALDPWVAHADPTTRRRGDVDPAPLAALGLPHLPFEAAAGAWLAPRMALASWRAARAGMQLRAPHFRAGLALSKHEAQRAVPLLAALVERMLPKILLYFDLADALYERLRPQVVVVTDETLPLLGRVALRAAERRTIPTVTLQHGLLLDDPMYYGPSVAERVALWGEEPRRFLVAHGCPPERLFVTGSTRFAALQPDGEALDFVRHLGLPPATRVLLFTSQPSGRDVSAEANRATLDALARAAQALPNVHLVVKAHPAQHAAELQDWEARLRALDAPATLCRELPLHPAMRGADLVVTVFSTTALEALRLDRPLLTINLTGKPDPLPYAARGAAVAAHQPAEVLPAVRQALMSGDAAQRAAARLTVADAYLGPADGQAVARLCALLHQATHEAAPPS